MPSFSKMRDSAHSIRRWRVVVMALQFQVLKLAPEATDVAMSIFSGIYNIGIGGGALLGSLVIAAWGLGLVGAVGAGIVLLALLILTGYRLFRRRRV
ncbi:hypothetical protein SAMN05443429_104120 [Cruoricaptor ignavus]|uniref:MFS transporter, DHA1 family, inner membrane transport protein n=2 Tax=Cruoricaptor ignavus TaxID=1118202 RepID=A0A1M6DWG8_9FLAO|nr:hypothetical protein SAMN05443429_104120 [Cruoricaptor ignavus]